jgi:hypothetical protein
LYPVVDTRKKEMMMQGMACMAITRVNIRMSRELITSQDWAASASGY